MLEQSPVASQNKKKFPKNKPITFSKNETKH